MQHLVLDAHKYVRIWCSPNDHLQIVEVDPAIVASLQWHHPLHYQLSSHGTDHE